MSYKALVNGKIHTVSGKVWECGSILWKGERIVAVGENLDLPADTQISDVKGRVIVPGMIDAHTHVGILEEIHQFEGDDVNEMADPVTPELRALDAVNPFDLGFRDAVEGGVTTVMTGPGSGNVIGGINLITKTAGKNLQDMVLIPQAGLKIAFGENPKSVYGEQKKMPMTRMAIAALLRQAFIDTQDYLAKKVKAKKDDDVIERDLGLENLSLVLAKKIPLRAHAHRADDIMTALRIAEEFDVEIIIEHGTEGHKIREELIRRNIPVVVGPTLANRAKVELAEISWKTAVNLNEGGVLVALTTDHPETPIQYLPVCAGLAVKYGMKEEDALKAITLNPARILKLEHRLGSLEEGKDADFVVLSGHPLDWRSCVEEVYINGNKVFDTAKRSS